MKTFDDRISVSNHILSKSRPHIVDPKINADVKLFDIHVAQRRIHRYSLANAASSTLPDQLGPGFSISNQKHRTRTEGTVTTPMNQSNFCVVSSNINDVTFVSVVHFEDCFWRWSLAKFYQSIKYSNCK